MTKLVVGYTDDGTISGWWHRDDEYDPGANEMAAPETVSGKELVRKKVDTSVDPPELVDNHDYRKPESVQREEISASSKQAYRDARSDGDQQAQLDILFEILTGEQP